MRSSPAKGRSILPYFLKKIQPFTPEYTLFTLFIMPKNAVIIKKIKGLSLLEKGITQDGGLKMEANRQRILVVDDHKNIRDLLSKMLSLMGYAVVAAGGGHEGFSLFIEGSFNLVITDLDMPRMDGWTLACHIKEQSPDTPIVLMSGSDKGTVFETLKRGCVDSVIFKPFSFEGIQKTIQKEIAKRPS